MRMANWQLGTGRPPEYSPGSRLMMVSASVASGYPTRHPRSSHVAGMAPSNYGTRLAMQYYLSLTNVWLFSYFHSPFSCCKYNTITIIHVYSNMKLMKIVCNKLTRNTQVYKVLETQAHTNCSDIRESYGMRKVDLWMMILVYDTIQCVCVNSNRVTFNNKKYSIMKECVSHQRYWQQNRACRIWGTRSPMYCVAAISNSQ